MKCAFPSYFFVGRVDLSYHHIHENSCEKVRSEPQEEKASPRATKMIESNSTNRGLNQYLHTRIERIGSIRGLREQNIERIANYKQKDRSDQEPGQKTECVQFDELGEGPEGPGRFKGEEKAKGGSDHDHSREIRLRNRQRGIVLIVDHIAG